MPAESHKADRKTLGSWRVALIISRFPRGTAVNSAAIMSRDYFDLTPEEQNIVLVTVATLRKAERFIESCEFCNPDVAKIPFDHILDEITGSDPSVTDYLFETPAMCPKCGREIK